METKLARGVRRVLPGQMTRKLEHVVRRNRTRTAAARHGNPAKSLKVIAVTGTNGKTTTLHFLNEILKEAGYKTAMFSTAMIEIDGVATRNDLNVTVASVAEMQQFFADAKKAHVKYVLVEATSHALSQHKFDGVPIEVAIMTNLTQDHLDYHSTMEQYAADKAILFKSSPRYIVLNRDDEWYEYFDQFHARAQKITYGKHEESEAHIDRTKLYRKGTEADVTIDHQTKLELATNLPGDYNAVNMAAAATAAYVMGVPLDAIIEGAANLEAIPGRFERPLDGSAYKLAYDVVVDYAHSPDGLEKLLRSAREITKNRLILVFGATGDRDKSKRPIMGRIAAELADRVIVTDEDSYSEEPAAIRRMVLDGAEAVKGGTMKALEIGDRREAIKKAMEIATRGDMVLVTGLGHEVFRITASGREEWNDADAVRSVAEELHHKT